MQIKNLIKKFISFLFIPLKGFNKQKNTIILQSSRRYLYNDNTRYLFEFLSQKKEWNIFWVTNNKHVKKYLKRNNYKFISWSNPFKLIFIAIRARIVIDNGDGYFNPFDICNSSKVIRITLQHGAGPKVTLAKSVDGKRQRDQILKINRFDYVNFPSEFAKIKIGIDTYHLSENKLVCFGYPRCDNYFHNNIVEESRKSKTLTQKYFQNYSNKDCLILYTPTWRPYEYSFPLSLMEDFEYSKFDEWLKDNEIIFFYTTHSNNPPSNMPNNLERIIKLDHEVDPLFDINKFMLEVDILFNDYSTTSTDFALLKRPQIFFMPDYEKYNRIKGFTENYRKILPGEEVHNFSGFLESILEAKESPNKVVETFSKINNNLLSKYYETNKKDSASKIEFFLKTII